ncbi:MAG: UPF0758 domain-containing protein [Candidatus Microsaccharimonas sp.]
MGQFEFERPRERMQRTGAGSLTTVELLQVLIASGTPQASSARIAKNVQSLFESTKGIPDFDVLLGINGLGVAKSCQLLAAIEFGIRRAQAPPGYIPIVDNRVQQASKTVLVARYINGAGVITGEFFAPLGGPPKNTLVLKRMFGEALANGARSIEITIGGKSQDIHILSTFILTVLRSFFDTASLLQISSTVYLANKHEAKRVKRATIYG